MRRAARIDENQPAIVEALRMVGAEVTPLHMVGQGVSDILVSWRQQWIVMEIKNPSKPKRDQQLKPDQVTWIGKQRAPVFIVYTPAEAVGILSMTRVP